MGQEGSKIKERIQQLQERLERAAARTGRLGEEIKVIAVTKGVPVPIIEEARAGGIEDFGENRVQEFLPKYAALGEQVRWHFIGRLQSNKAKFILDKIVLLHSLDRVSLAEKLQNLLAGKGRVLPVLLQVNLAGEETKSGFRREEVFSLLENISRFPNLCVQGLMTIAPYGASPAEVRSVFRGLRELAEEIKSISFPGVEMVFLSMGMTSDFEIAVEEGANIVRIGTAIFGPCFC